MTDGPVMEASPPRINVLHVFPVIGYGGIEKLMTDVLTRLPRDRFSVTCCALYPGPIVGQEILQRHGIPCHTVGQGRRGMPNPRMIASLSRLLRTGPVHICHTHNIAPEIFGHLAAMLARTPIVVHHEHSVTFNDHVPRKLLKQLFAAKKDLIIAVSDHVHTFLVERLGIDGESVRVIQNGIRLSPNGKKTQTGTHLCTVARLAPEKGVSVLIEAVARIRREVPDVRLTIVGDGVLRPQLEDLARRLGLSEAVKFVGFTSRPEVHCRDCSIFVLPSREEGFGLALLEAMDAGKAVVASRVGAIPEVIRDGVDGVLVQPDNPRALADAVLTLLKNPDVLEHMGRAGFERSRHFAIDHTVQRITEAYEDLIRLKMGLVFDEPRGKWVREP